MNFKLGKKPARNAIELKFSKYFNAAELPAVPQVIGHPWIVRTWGMFGNDQYGDCVWAGAAHETMMLCADASALVPTFTSRTVLSDYSASTGFNPAMPSTDNGTDAQDAAAYRQKTGIVDILGNRHKIDVYTALRVGDLNELALAVFLFGAVGVGIELPESAEGQFRRVQPWVPIPGDSTVGGHYISCVGRNSLGDFLFVSWGRLQAATPEWVTTYMDEGIAYLSRERLRLSGLSPQGYNESALEDDFRQLTG